jgi:signal peptidase I
LAVIEAKSDELPYNDGVTQAKKYAKKLGIRHTYSTNGLEIYHINMEMGEEGDVNEFQSPENLYNEYKNDKMKENKEDYQLEYEYIFLMTYTDLITKNDLSDKDAVLWADVTAKETLKDKNQSTEELSIKIANELYKRLNK